MPRQVKKWSLSEKKILEELLHRNLNQEQETQEIANLTRVLDRSYLSINSKLWDMRKKMQEAVASLADVQQQLKFEPIEVMTYSYNEEEKTITIKIKLK
jgi:hypothetical protein